MMKIGLIGCGYWGKNYVSTIRNIPDIELKYIADIDNSKIPIGENIKYIEDYKRVLDDNEIDGVIIATPSETHYKIGSDAINAGKNVLIEKPLTTNIEDSIKLCSSAKEKNVILMTGHIFKYNSAIRYLKNIIDNGEIGELRYLESRRVGLGPVRMDVSVAWDFASHDIYISEFLTGKNAESVSYQGISHNGRIDDIACLNLKFKNPDILSTIYVNWEHPVKERKLIVGGTKKSVLFDDIEISEKIRIYDKGVDFMPYTGDYGEFQATTREGDILIPKIKITAPLEEELKHFYKCVKKGERCLSDGYDGLSVVRILSMADESRKNKGLEMKIE